MQEQLTSNRGHQSWKHAFLEASTGPGGMALFYSWLCLQMDAKTGGFALLGIREETLLDKSKWTFLYFEVLFMSGFGGKNVFNYLTVHRINEEVLHFV